MRRLLVAVLVLMVPVAAYLVDRQDDDGPEPAPAPAETGETSAIGDDAATNARVTRVHDGDSFIAELDSGGDGDVRMIGMNAPDHGECLSREARAALSALIKDKRVDLRQDVTERDRYDRLLRYVYADGVFANLALVEQGLALTIGSEPDIAHEPELDAAQQRARAAGIGIWNPNACGPAASTALQIIEVEPDPRGRDELDLNGEYVVIHNTGDVPVTMTGWKLRDDSTRNRFWFPDGFVLDGGRQVTVHVGQGDDRDDALFWDRRHPIWDNVRDTALLLDPNGNVVSTLDVRGRVTR